VYSDAVTLSFGVFFMVRMILWIILMSLMMGMAVAELTPDLNAGREKSQPCVTCHNVDGNSTVPAWPKIAGQPVKYLKEQLEEFRKGDKGNRNDPVMFSIVHALTDQDIADLAAYFSSLKSTPGETQQQYVALGEKIYRGGNPNTGVPACGPSCHGPRGEGNPPAAFPPLSGQHPEYILDQLRKFKSGARADDPNGIMRDIAKRMTDEEMQAVSNYVSGLH
jgi:cytochrome c553